MTDKTPVEYIIETVDLHKSFGNLHVLKGVSERVRPPGR